MDSVIRDMSFPRKGIGCSTKKGKRRLTEPPDPNDPVVDDKGMKVNPTNITPISWKDKLMGDMANVMNTQKDENFDLQKGDAKNEIVDGIPSITFSERVHQFIAEHMSRRRRKPRAREKPIDDLDSRMAGGSRFRVLNEINGKENNEESWAFNGINRSRISRKSNVGIEETAREEGKVALSNKSENIKKGFGKIRGKGVIVANGPNPNNNVLKPSNNLGASSSRPFANPFEDGSRIRTIIMDTDLDPIHFQAVGSILNNRKNMVVKILGILGVSFVVEEQNRPRHSILNHKIGQNFGQRLVDKIGEKYCENMDQELVTLSDDVSLTILIAFLDYPDCFGI
ncbi:hypothetical protein Gohar_028212 [Gossypium harknessii]|uniref:Uncharacterized protein n=1 Tax=Gossypium harknessii TaxID=34285 RepID=A0A7J9IAT7_9ROSI|nr:hypothetical protein [Gossypium harknessii]